MNILLVHPDDSIEESPAEAGAWAGIRWDLVVDLGWSGRHAYSLQAASRGFRLFSIYDALDHDQHRRRIRELLALGWDQLLDSESVDWWETYAVHPFSQLEEIMLVSALAEQIPESRRDFRDSSSFCRTRTVASFEPRDQNFFAGTRFSACEHAAGVI